MFTPCVTQVGTSKLIASTQLIRATCFRSDCYCWSASIVNPSESQGLATRS